MLLAYCGYHTVLRMHQVADFLNIAYVARAHFTYKHLVCCTQIFPYGAHNAKCSIIIFRRHQHVVLGAQKRRQIVFYARFTIAACDADNF